MTVWVIGASAPNAAWRMSNDRMWPNSPLYVLLAGYRYYHYQPGSNSIIVYCKHITHARTHTRTRIHARMHTHARTRARTYRCRCSGCRCSMDPWRQTVMELTPVPVASNGRSLLHSNKHSHGRHGFPEVFGVFRV